MNFSNFINMCLSGISNCFSWLFNFDSAVGGYLLNGIVAVFTIYTLVRLFLVPLFGNSLSDVVSGRSKDLSFEMKKCIGDFDRKTVVGFVDRNNSKK